MRLEQNFVLLEKCKAVYSYEHTDAKVDMELCFLNNPFGKGSRRLSVTCDM